MISAAASMERIYGFLITQQYGGALLKDWQNARTGLDVLADYKQVVSRLASAAATLVEPHSQEAKTQAQKDVWDCVNKLQNIRSDL